MEPEASLLGPQEPVTGPILSQINPVHSPEPYYSMIYA
jgi:hypothetical protein